MAKKKFTEGDDTINLGKGNNVKNALGGNDNVGGGGGDDTLHGNAGNDFIRGGIGADTLFGDEGDDRLDGGDGDDTLDGGVGINIIEGGAGSDVAVIAGKFADAKITQEGTGFKIVTATGTHTVTNVENFKFDDGVKGANQLLPGGGQTFTLQAVLDNIVGTAGDDTIIGDSNTLTADVINGGEGKDKLVAINGTTLNASPIMSGVETIELTNSGAGVSTFNMSNVKDVTNFNAANGNGDIVVNGATSIPEVMLTSVGTSTSDTDVALNFAAAAVAGTTDALKLTLTNVVLNDAGPGTADLTFNGIETLTLASAGTANAIENLAGGTSLKSVVATGAGAFSASFNATGTGLTSYDGSGVEGKQTITFNAVSDVVVKGGKGADSFAFGATLSSKDSVDAGDGIDTVSVNGADFQAGDGLTALNSFKGVERLAFTGATGATINDTTLTATLAAIVFNTTGNDTVIDAVASSSYGFGTANAGTATFNLAVGQTTLNLFAEGDLTATTAATRDADVTVLSTGSASVVNYTSTGINTANEFNDIATVTATANALFNLKGDGNTRISGFTNATNFDAAGLSGDLTVVGSAAADIIRGGTGSNVITGLGGIDQIFLSNSTTKVDVVNIAPLATFAARDVVTGFTAGVGGDHLRLDDAKTSDNVAGVTLQSVGTTNPVILGTTDVFEFTLNIATNLDADGNGAVVTGATGFVNEVVPANWAGYLAAYSGGNAYIYTASDANGDGDISDAGEVVQIAQLKAIAVGALEGSNFEY